MLKSIDLQVQYEGIELLKTLVREGKLGSAIIIGLLPLLETVEISPSNNKQYKQEKGDDKINNNKAKW